MLPAPPVPSSPRSRPQSCSRVSGQWSEVGGQAFWTLACMACGSHSQYSASRSAGGGRGPASAWSCQDAGAGDTALHRRASSSRPAGSPCTRRPTHTWGPSSRRPAGRPGSRPSLPPGLSAGSPCGAAACGQGWAVGRWPGTRGDRTSRAEEGDAGAERAARLAQVGGSFLPTPATQQRVTSDHLPKFTPYQNHGHAGVT